MLSTALLRFLHGERSGKQSQQPGWAPSCTPLLLGSVLQPPPSPLPGHSCSGFSSGSSYYIPCWPSPLLLWGFGFIHPSLLAPSQQPAAGWQGLGRRPAHSAHPRQSGTTLASPQGPSSCAPLALPPHQAWLHRCCIDPNTVLCTGRTSSTILCTLCGESAPLVPGLGLCLTLSCV